jgi:hypothetical protein
MKIKIILLNILFIFSIICVNAQNIKVTLEFNGIIEGVDNHIKVFVDIVSPENVIVETDNGEISGEKGDFILRPQSLGVINLKVYKKDAGGKKTYIDTKTYKVKPIPEPIITIANRKGGSITKEELLAANGPVAIAFNKEELLITSFYINTKVKDFYRECLVDSNVFDISAIDIISRAKVGDIIYICCVNYLYKDEKRRSPAEFKFKLE